MNHSHAINESLSWLTLGGCSQNQSNFRLQFSAHNATWEVGLKCVLDHAIPLPETLEWLPICGTNTLMRYQSLPGPGLRWPLQSHLCSQLLAPCCSYGTTECPHISLCFLSPVGFSHPLSLPFFFSPFSWLTHHLFFKIQLTHSFSHLTNTSRVPIN